VSLSSPYIRCKRVEFRTIREKVPAKDSPILVEVARLEQVKTERSKADLDAIDAI